MLKIIFDDMTLFVTFSFFHSPISMPWYFIFSQYKTGWRGGLVVGRRTCDLRVAGSSPGRDAAAQQP